MLAVVMDLGEVGVTTTTEDSLAAAAVAAVAAAAAAVAAATAAADGGSEAFTGVVCPSSASSPSSSSIWMRLSTVGTSASGFVADPVLSVTSGVALADPLLFPFTPSASAGA